MRCVISIFPHFSRWLFCTDQSRVKRADAAAFRSSSSSSSSSSSCSSFLHFLLEIICLRADWPDYNAVIGLLREKEHATKSNQIKRINESDDTWHHEKKHKIQFSTFDFFNKRRRQLITDFQVANFADLFVLFAQFLPVSSQIEQISSLITSNSIPISLPIDEFHSKHWPILILTFKSI